MRSTSVGRNSLHIAQSLPGFIGTAGSESNSNIKRSTSGRYGADGTSVSIPPFGISAETGTDATSSDRFTGTSAECATDDTAEATAADAADHIPDSELQQERDELDKRPWRRRQPRRRSTTQVVKVIVAITTMKIMATLAPIDEDCGSDAGGLGDPVNTEGRGGGGRTGPGSISAKLKHNNCA